MKRANPERMTFVGPFCCNKLKALQQCCLADLLYLANRHPALTFFPGLFISLAYNFELEDKALNDLWPEDIIRNQFRWIPDKLQPWTDIEAFLTHSVSQFRFALLENFDRESITNGDFLDVVRSLIQVILWNATHRNELLFVVRSSRPIFRFEFLQEAHRSSS